jgi:signal transduction histidine kinase
MLKLLEPTDMPASATADLSLWRKEQSSRIICVIAWLAGAIGMIVALLVPASYFIVGYSYEARHLVTEAALQGASLSRAGAASIDAWRANPAELQALLPVAADSHKDVMYSLFDETGAIVAEYGRVQQAPVIVRGALLTFDDGTLALLEVERSLMPLLLRTAIAGAAGLVLAGVLLVVAWRLPARVIRRVFDRLVRSEMALLEAYDSAETANRTKSEFLATMSHELRTPLNAIIGFADMMARAGFGPLGHKRYEEYVADIRASGTHLLEMVNDILDITKAEAGKLELADDPMDVAEVADAALRMVAPQARTAGVAVHNRIPRDLPFLRGDERRVTQVVLNLTANAIKFTDAGGSVDLWGYVDGSGDMVVCVRDTGIGIAEADIDRVMKVFQQAESGHTRRYGGTGLGLPLAKRLVESHGGSLLLESQLGAGTSVTFRFPAARLSVRSALAQAS